MPSCDSNTNCSYFYAAIEAYAFELKENWNMDFQRNSTLDANIMNSTLMQLTCYKIENILRLMNVNSTEK